MEELRGELRFGRLVAVMDEADGGAVWGAVYEEVLRWNAKACGVGDGLAESDGSWAWLDSLHGSPLTEDDPPSPAVAEDVSVKAKAADAKQPPTRKSKAEDKAAKADSPPPAQPIADSPAPPARRVGADHLTGAFITDGRMRWLILEGLSVTRPNASALSAVQALLVQAKRDGAKVRLLVDDAMAFPERLYEGSALSLMRLRLSAPLSSVVGKASSLSSSSSACFLALSKLSMLAKRAVVPGLQSAWEGRVLLTADEVRLLQERWAKQQRLDDIYGAEFGQREKAARKAKREKMAADERLQQQDEAAKPALQPRTAHRSPLLLSSPSVPLDRSGRHRGAGSIVGPPCRGGGRCHRARLCQRGCCRRHDGGEGGQSSSAVGARPPAALTDVLVAAEYHACLRALREACHADPRHHYTFHPSYLHSSIPRWESPEEAEREERRLQRQRWLNPRGFVVAGRADRAGGGGLFSCSTLLSESERRLERDERRPPADARRRRVSALGAFAFSSSLSEDPPRAGASGSRGRLEILQRDQIRRRQYDSRYAAFEGAILI